MTGSSSSEKDASNSTMVRSDEFENQLVGNLTRAVRGDRKAWWWAAGLNAFAALIAIASFAWFGMRASALQNRAKTLDEQNRSLEQVEKGLQKEIVKLEALRDKKQQQVAAYLQTLDGEQSAAAAQQLLDEPDAKHEAASAAQLWNSGFHAFEAGDLEQARVYYTKAIEVDPKFIQALNSLGMLEMRAKRYEAAIVLFQGLLKQAQYAPAVANLGHAYLSIGQEAEAMVHCARALQLPRKPSNAESLKARLRKWDLECDFKSAGERFHRVASEEFRKKNITEAVRLFLRGCQVGNGGSCSRLRSLCDGGLSAACPGRGSGAEPKQEALEPAP